MIDDRSPFQLAFNIARIQARILPFVSSPLDIISTSLLFGTYLVILQCLHCVIVKLRAISLRHLAVSRFSLLQIPTTDVFDVMYADYYIPQFGHPPCKRLINCAANRKYIMFKKRAVLKSDQHYHRDPAVPSVFTVKAVGASNALLHPKSENAGPRSPASLLVHNSLQSSPMVPLYPGAASGNHLEFGVTKLASKNTLTLTIDLQTAAGTTTVEYRHNAASTTADLVQELRRGMEDKNTVFRGNSIAVDYLLALPNELISTLKTKRLALKVNPIKMFPFKNNPLVNMRIVKCIGAGGFSRVFLVEIYGVYMALKVIPKKLLEQNGKEVIVLNEKQILIALNRHPFVTKIHYCFQTSKHICLGMEYCAGGELFNLLRKLKRMKEDEARFYFLQVLSALKALHQKGIVYRDLKPQNVIIDNEGHIRLADFGLSKKLDQDVTHSFCGSAEYMAPEMLLKQGHGFSIDYYCIGALLYQLVTGLPPHYCRNQQELFANILTNSLKFPDHKLTLSPQIKSLLRGLLNKNPKYRLGTTMGIMEIFAHPWITNLSITDLVNKRLTPPFKPDLLCYNFDDSEFKNQQKEALRQLRMQIRQTQVNDLMFDDFYFQSKEMALVAESVRIFERRSTSNLAQKRRELRTPESKTYLRHSYESVSSPKNYTYIKTDQKREGPILYQRNPQPRPAGVGLKKYPLRRLKSSEAVGRDRSVQDKAPRVHESASMSLERRRVGQQMPNDRGGGIVAYQRNLSVDQFKRFSLNVCRNQRPDVYRQPFGGVPALQRVKSTEIPKRGFLQREKFRGYYNR